MARNDKTVKLDVFRAAEEGIIGEVEELLAGGEDVNTVDAWGNTPLYLAARGGHEELVRRLLGRGASTDMMNTRGQTALHAACERGHKGVAQMLVEGGANVDPYSNYLPPLHFAMFHCDSVLVDRLMEKGADINREDADGATILHRACCCDCDKVVEMLLDRGANIDVKNQSGMTALDYAVVYGHSAVVNVFIDKFPEMIHLQDTKGWTCLHKACADNNTLLVRCLLNNGGEIDLATKYGSTPLHLALKRGSFEVAEVLLDSGARVDIKDIHGNTPLHEAAVKPTMDDEGQILVFHKLLDRGAGVDVKNKDNKAPYDLCQKDKRYHALIQHITKLRVANLSVDLNNVEVDSELKSKCLLELEKIKETKLFESTSLKIVFSKFQNPYYLRNERLRISLDRFLQSPQSLECFPLYKHILRNTMESSKCRLSLLTTVSQILSNGKRNQWWNALPDLVQDYVLLYLNDNDLKELEIISISGKK